MKRLLVLLAILLAGCSAQQPRMEPIETAIPATTTIASTTEVQTTTTESPTTTETPTTTRVTVTQTQPKPTTTSEPPVTTTTPSTAPVAEPAPSGSFLECVKWRESRGNYGAVNSSSGAAGAYQFLPSTWNNVASRAGRPDLVGMSPQYAAPADQDAMAETLLAWQGTTPWAGPGC